MYGNWLANAAVAGGVLFAVIACVVVHYEGLIIVSRRLARQHAGPQRIKVLYAIFAVIFLHLTEIGIFGLTYWVLLQWPECGQLGGDQAGGHFLDMVYFSATTFSTLGVGDLAPIGPIRMLAGTESVTGLLLITWSASFTYLEMERFWRRA